MNCIQPTRACGRDRLVGAVVGLDLVDRREDLPRHSVLHGGRLIDRQQEQRDAVEGEGLGRCRGGGQLGRQRAGRSGCELGRGGYVVGTGGSFVPVAPVAPVARVLDLGRRLVVAELKEISCPVVASVGAGATIGGASGTSTAPVAGGWRRDAGRPGGEST